MSKRKYTHIKEIENEIIAMREAGMTRQRIADKLDLKKEQIKNKAARYNRRNNRLLQGILTKTQRQTSPKADRQHSGV